MLPAMQNQNGLAAAIKDAGYQPSTSSGGDELFCKFDYKTGDFLLGRDAENIVEEVVTIHTDSIAHGWVCWSGGKPTKTLVNFTQPLPNQPAPIGDDGFVEARAIMFATDDGIQAILEGNSYGIRKGIDDLMMSIKQQAMVAENANYLYPQVELGSNSYKHSAGNIIHNPVFKVVNWCDVEGNIQGETKKIEAQAEEPVVEKEAAAAPKRRRRKAA